jgi:Flp pilus assembly protein TadD
MRVGKLDDALRDFQRAATVDPRSSKVHANLAVLYFAQKRFPEAWNEVYRCRALGGVPNPQFIADLVKASGQPDNGR